MSSGWKSNETSRRNPMPFDRKIPVLDYILLLFTIITISRFKWTFPPWSQNIISHISLQEDDGARTICFRPFSDRIEWWHLEQHIEFIDRRNSSHSWFYNQEEYKKIQGGYSIDLHDPESYYKKDEHWHPQQNTLSNTYINKIKILHYSNYQQTHLKTLEHQHSEHRFSLPHSNGFGHALAVLYYQLHFLWYPQKITPLRHTSWEGDVLCS